MKIALALCALSLLLALAAANPIVKRATDNNAIDPLNEVYVFANEEEPSVEVEGEHGEREKRKIGIVKLGVTNGIINFVFGKLDALIDAKTRAITVLDESNKAKNAAYGIDNTQSATGAFISNLIGQKIQAGTASIGPLINSATTFISGAKSGLTGAFASKLGPLTSIVGGLSAGSGGSSSGGSGGSGGSELIGSLLAGFSQGSGGLGSLSGGNNDSDDNDDDDDDDDSKSSSGSSAGAGAGRKISTTTEDIPVFDRVHVALDYPPPALGTGFTLITSVSKILSSIILNSARRTQSVLEVFKPVFRGAFAIKGLPSDRTQ
ncbi:peroxidase-like protein 2 [Venturia canescens]|uniref:peroxidase-like protein 2 n=1 Tax=Venturia canescens TaxID=32260 RepID=UPI001C9C496E|nr:peroxidase-like protein 2 [Venturia canescens]XP_043286723.1 peroxidase-like protein 2 [Venturia canescens]XP_043286724.1 peroxidase-like protein 2 [Venturia canescens]XP_043286726.1 peroxidase-like protein 2 [Venturia canescens]XP_043286727.1 peroxidase-like protein 2 [Venturia canescens]